jgi:hypothetical protein
MGKRGRPLKEAPAGKRVPLGLRVTAEIKTKLAAAAVETNRSQSQEAELRLERSFTNDEIIARLDRIEALLLR